MNPTVPNPILKRPRVLAVFARAQAQFGMTRDQIRGPGYTAVLVAARWYVIAQLYEPPTPDTAGCYRYSEIEVGKIVNRTASTVHHALKKMAQPTPPSCSGLSRAPTPSFTEVPHGR